MYDVITIGSGTIDCFVDTGSRLFHDIGKGKIHIPFGSKVLVDELLFYTGGGGTNCAVSLSRLGLKTAWIGKIGSGQNGGILLNQMKKEKVDTSLVIQGKNCRTGFSVILDAKGHDRTILAFKGSNNSIEWKDVKKSKINAKWIYCASMLGKSFKTLEKITDFARKKRIKIAFNPSAYLAKKGSKYLGKVIKNTNLLVMNDEEAYYLTKEKNVKKAMQKLYKMGPEIIVITKGKKGAEAYDGEKFYSIKAGKVKVIESTGAGDSFTSAFLTGIIKKNDINFALRLGLANSESVITHHGAKNKLLTWKEAMTRIK